MRRARVAIRSFVCLAAAVLPAPLAAGCNPGVDIPVTVYASPGFDPYANASKVRITAIGTDEETGAREILKSREFSSNRSTATLGLIPYSLGLQIKFEVLDGADAVIALGSSLLHDILPDTPAEELPAEILIFLAPTNRVVPAIVQATGGPSAMTMGRIGHATVALADGHVLVTGGGLASDTLGNIDVTTISRSAEIYDAESGRFITITDAVGMPTPMSVPRAYHTATLLSDGAVLLTGGLTQQMGLLSTLSSGETVEANGCILPGPTDVVQTGICAFIAATGTMVDARAHHAATLRADGSVFVSGGTFEVDQMDVEYHATTDLFTRANGFAPGGAALMGDERACHTQTLLPDGSILVLGGISADTLGDPEILASAERFTGTMFEAVAPMTSPRACHTANLTFQADDVPLVLVYGGYTDVDAGFRPSLPSQLIEVFEPSTGAFNTSRSRVLPGPGGMTPIALAEHTASTLPDGRIVVLGGKTGGSLSTVYAGMIVPPPSSTGEMTFVSDPATVLLTPRSAHGAAVLPGGQVLLVGGFAAAGGNPITHATAEIYTPVD